MIFLSKTISINSIILIVILIENVIAYDEEADLQQKQREVTIKIPIAKLLAVNASPNVTSMPSTTPVIFDERERESSPKDDVPTFKCPLNSFNSKCRNPCEPTCEDPDRTPCRDRYCYPGCECNPGFVREHRNWSCVAIEQCPKCGVNEHYRDCGSGCQSTCENYQNVPPYCNTHHCTRGCFCDYGYVRDESLNGTCVKIEECPQKCGTNEYYDVRGAPCVRTPDNPRPKCLDNKPEPACVCNTGFVRNNATNQCQPIAPNFVEKCGGNETFSYCGSDCARTCNNETKRKFCPTVCYRGCFCNDGHVRDSYNGRCVLSKDCYVWRPEIIEPLGISDVVVVPDPIDTNP